MKNKKNLYVRTLALILTIVMIGGMLPSMVFAFEHKLITKTTGDFIVNGGTLGTDYSYADNTLTILTDTSLAIGGTTTTDRIVVQEDVRVNITLKSVKIELGNYGSPVSPMEVKDRANVTITLEGDNRLKGSSGYHNVSGGEGILCAGNATLTMGGTGSLSCTGGDGGQASSGTGGWGGAGIKGNATVTGGSITVTGGFSGENYGHDPGGSRPGGNGIDGTLTMQDGNLTAIGGKGNNSNNFYHDSGNGGAGITALIMSGGRVNAIGGNCGKPARGGDKGQKGNGVNDATPSGGMLLAQGGKEGKGGGAGVSNLTSPQNCIVLSNETGNVYGNYTLTEDFELQAQQTLTVNNGNTLTVQTGVTFTNKGVITNNGTITNNGIINNYGTISPNAPSGGTVNSVPRVTVSFSKVSASYGEEITITATVQKSTTRFRSAAQDTVDFYLGDTGGTLLGTADVTSIGDTAIATLKMTKAVWETSGASWSIDGSTGLLASTGTGVLLLTKADRTMAAPTDSNVEMNSITLNPVVPSAGSGDGAVEYGYASTNNSADVADWQSNTTFNNLTYGTTYYFFARVTNGKYYNAAISAGTAIPTKDTFTAKIPLDTGQVDCTFKITADGQVQVGDGSNRAIDANSAGTLTIPATVTGRDSKDYSVTKVGNQSFGGCESLIAVELPTDIATIGEGAFEACHALMSITLQGTTPPALGTDAFKGTHKELKIHVPVGTSTAYKEDFNFAIYRDIIVEPAIDANDDDWSSNKDLTQWQNSDITIIPENGYTLISTDETNWENSLVISTDGIGSVTFYLKKGDGTHTKGITVDYKLDKTAPIAQITIGENKWNTFLDEITFGLFFKNTEQVTITGTDTGSGVAKIEYFKSDSVVEDLAAISWTEGKKISIQPNEKAVVYARVTDYVGNEVIVNSDGLVFYSEAALMETTVEYNIDKQEDITVSINLNGNTLNSVKDSHKMPIKDTDYIVSGDSVTINKEYLATALTGDSLMLTFMFNPMGVETDKVVVEDILTVTKHIHTWNAGEITTEPTHTQDGVKTFTCTVCGQTQTQVIPKPQSTNVILDESTGISVGYEDNSPFDAGTVLDVKPFSQTEMDKFKGNIDKFAPDFVLGVLYNMNLLEGGVAIQPKGKVKVGIPLTDNMSSMTNLQIVYIDEKGDVTVMTSEVNGDRMTFVTDHFSNYGIIGKVKSTDPGKNSGDGSNNQNSKNHNYPKTGDGTSVVLFVFMMGISGTILIVLGRRKKGKP